MPLHQTTSLLSSAHCTLRHNAVHCLVLCTSIVHFLHCSAPLFFWSATLQSVVEFSGDWRRVEDILWAVCIQQRRLFRGNIRIFTVGKRQKVTLAHSRLLSIHLYLTAAQHFAGFRQPYIFWLKSVHIGQLKLWINNLVEFTILAIQCFLLHREG